MGWLVSSFPGILENHMPPGVGPTTSSKPVGVGGCKEAEARQVHSQARQSASSQLPVFQVCVALSRILQKEAHALLDSRQEPPPTKKLETDVGSQPFGSNKGTWRFRAQEGPMTFGRSIW